MAEAPALPVRPVLELVAMLTTWYGDLDTRLYEVADEYRAWAAANPDAHAAVLPELLSGGLLHQHKVDAVRYLIEGRAPTCEEIEQRYDAWFFTVAIQKDRELIRQIQGSARMREILVAEHAAAAMTDPKEKAEALQAAGRLIAQRLKIEGPTLL